MDISNFDDDDDDNDDDEFDTPKETSEVMPALESENSAEQRRTQKGQGLKILPPNQILSRLPISLT